MIEEPAYRFHRRFSPRRGDKSPNLMSAEIAIPSPIISRNIPSWVTVLFPMLIPNLRFVTWHVVLPKSM